jgi:hypothetical protein
MLGQEPLAVRATNNDEPVGRRSTADFFIRGTGRGFREGDTDGQGGPATTTKTSHPPVLKQEPLALEANIRGDPGRRRSAAIFFVEGTGLGSGGGDTDGQGGGATATKRSRLPVLDQEPLALKTKIHGELGRQKSAANFFVGGTGCGFSEGDMGGMQGGATATAKSHLPVLGQELPAVTENNHGKLVGCGNAANFVPAMACRGDGNVSTAPIRHSHWGPLCRWRHWHRGRRIKVDVAATLTCHQASGLEQEIPPPYLDSSHFTFGATGRPISRSRFGQALKHWRILMGRCISNSG